MKSSDKPGGHGNGKNGSVGAGGDRRQFLHVLGAATVGAAGIDAAFISSAFGAQSVVTEIPRAQVKPMLNTAIAKSLHPEQYPMIEQSLAAVGLTNRVDDIARSYQIVGAVTGKVKTLTIIPYHPVDRKSQIVGGIGVSTGSPSSGVSVKLDGTKVVSYTTHDVFFGKLVTRTFSPDQLANGIAPLVEQKFPREAVTPDITVETSADLSVTTFRALLADEQAKGIYSPAQVRGFLTNTPSMRLMAQLQYARHRGLTMSPGNACCSCCSCCWGCCSCTSAASSSYLSEKYRSRAANRRIGA